jgi:hypothetical protein
LSGKRGRVNGHGVRPDQHFPGKLRGKRCGNGAGAKFGIQDTKSLVGQGAGDGGIREDLAGIFMDILMQLEAEEWFISEIEVEMGANLERIPFYFNFYPPFGRKASRTASPRFSRSSISFSTKETS